MSGLHPNRALPRALRRALVLFGAGLFVKLAAQGAGAVLMAREGVLHPFAAIALIERIKLSACRSAGIAERNVHIFMRMVALGVAADVYFTFRKMKAQCHMVQVALMVVVVASRDGDRCM
jgi:hypothetical protein